MQSNAVGESSRSVVTETTTSRYTSEGSKYGGSRSTENSALSKPNDLGFQYEDIQSFRDRQKIEGDGLQLHRRRLSGNIVGTANKGDGGGDVTSHDSGYSSGIANDLEKSGESGVHHYSSSVREYKSYGTSQDDRSAARDKILSDGKSGVTGSQIHSSVTSREYKSSRDGGGYGDDRLARLLEDSKSRGTGSNAHSRVTFSDYKSSRDGGSPRDKLLGDYKSSGITESSHLRSSITSGDSRDLLKDRYSREKLLAEARAKASGTSALSHSSTNSDYKISGLSSRLSGGASARSGSPGSSTYLHSRSSDYKSSSSNTSVPRDDRFSRTDALVAKYLDSSRYKSKLGSDIDLDRKRLSPLTGIKEEEKDTARRTGDTSVTREKHHSVSGKPMSYLPTHSSYEDLLKMKREDSLYSSKPSSVLDKKHEISSSSRLSYGDVSRNTDYRSGISPSSRDRRSDSPGRLSYGWQDSRKEREKAIDRLLDTTRRYSADSILDKPSHDKRLDDVIGAMSDKNLSSSTTHLERHVRETRFGGGLKDGERVTAMSPEMLKYQSKDSPRTRYQTPYTSLDHSHHRTGGTPDRETIYDKLRRGSGSVDNLRTESRSSGGDNSVYERLYSSPDLRLKGMGSPVPMSDRVGLPLDKYDKPIARHGTTKEDMLYGKEIVSKYPERQVLDGTNVRETTRTSVMQRSFASRNGEVIKDEVHHHDEIRHGGQNGVGGIDGYDSTDIPTRIQRYPALSNGENSKGAAPTGRNLDDVMKLTGLDNTGDTTNYQERTRRDDVTRIQDDSNFRTKVHRTDVNTNVNIYKEIAAPRRDNRKSGKVGIADLKSKIEALTKSVDEMMDLKRKRELSSYVEKHTEHRRSSKDIVNEELPKIERYEVKSKRYEPKEIGMDHVDYVYKKVELEDTPKKPEHVDVELNIQSMWLSKEQRGRDLGLCTPTNIELAPENRAVEWWNVPTAEDADRFLCIGDWKWWNANTTEGVDQIMGVQAIDKETGATGAIIAKYQGEEQPVQWAWIEAANQPTASEKRRTLTRVLRIDSMDSSLWDDKTSTKTDVSGDKRPGIADVQWWNANTTEAAEHSLGAQDSNVETSTILATYDEGTKPTAWTWVQSSQKAPKVSVERHQSFRSSSRDILVDETDKGKVELLIRVKDEETQDPRFIAIRPGPVEKAIIVHQAVESELPDTRNMWGEGKQKGMTVRNGVVQMKIKDLTPEEREAWAHVMGMEDKNFKLEDDETFEIPVKFVDKNRRVELNEDLYAVPQKKSKKKASTKSVKNTQVEETKKLDEKKRFSFEKKKKEKKESDSDRKKRESKIKKLEAEKKKKEETEKKKKEQMEKKKREETRKLEKKRESERIKEMEKKRKEEKKKKGVESVKKKKVTAVKSAPNPPVVDRSKKPPSIRIKEFDEQELRRHSDVVDAEMVQGGSFTPKKFGLFALNGKGPTPRPQSARARMTTYTQSQSVKKVFEERGSNLTSNESPPIKVLKAANVSQRVKDSPSSPDQTDAIKHKSGSLQRRSGSAIAVPLRGGGSKQTNGTVNVVNSQVVQNQMPPGQNIRQTTVQESHSYRTETHVMGNDAGASAVLPQLAGGHVGPGNNFGQNHIGAGQVHGSGGQGHVETSHMKVNQGVFGQPGAGNFGMMQNVGGGQAGVHQTGGGHIGVQQFSGSHGGVQNVGWEQGGEQVGTEHVQVQQSRGGSVGSGNAGAGDLGSVALRNKPTDSSTEYRRESGVHELPDGSIVHKDVSQVRTTSWAVEEGEPLNLMYY